MKMKNNTEFYFDCSGDSVAKYGETQCGDVMQIIRKNGSLTAVLADGMGSGIRANLLATVSVRTLTSLLDRGVDAAEAAGSVASNLPVDERRGIRYAAFTVMQVFKTGSARIVRMNMPPAVLLRRGKPLDTPEKSIERNGSTLKALDFTIKRGDTIAVFSDGLVNAGTGGCLGAGWQTESIVNYLVSAYRTKITAEKVTGLLLSAGKSLYLSKPGDDLSVIAVRAFKRGDMKDALPDDNPQNI